MNAPVPLPHFSQTGVSSSDGEVDDTQAGFPPLSQIGVPLPAAQTGIPAGQVAVFVLSKLQTGGTYFPFTNALE